MSTHVFLCVTNHLHVEICLCKYGTSIVIWAQKKDACNVIWAWKNIPAAACNLRIIARSSQCPVANFFSSAIRSASFIVHCRNGTKRVAGLNTLSALKWHFARRSAQRHAPLLSNWSSPAPTASLTCLTSLLPNWSSPAPTASLCHLVYFMLVRHSHLGRVLRIKDSGQHVLLDAFGRACGSAVLPLCRVVRQFALWARHY